MKGYKGFNPDMTCRGFQYEVGKVYETDKPIALCAHGFHFCKELIDCFMYYNLYGNKFAVVEALGDVDEDEATGKCVTNKIKIVEILSENDVLKKANSGNYNTGYGNYGNYNTGLNNKGSFNSGCKNTGDRNTGSYNSGFKNVGHHNLGDHNAGDGNKGNRNVGNCNDGHYNTGDYNTGDFNISSCNTGCFMTIEPTMWLFNKPSGITVDMWNESKARDILSYVPRERSSRQDWWDNLEPYQRKHIISIPNFDPDIFKQCTGIDVTRGRKKGGSDAEEYSMWL